MWREIYSVVAEVDYTSTCSTLRTSTVLAISRAELHMTNKDWLSA